MKKFDPEKELNLVKTKNDSYITSKFNSAFIPLLVIGCSVLALIGVAFSSYYCLGVPAEDHHVLLRSKCVPIFSL